MYFKSWLEQSQVHVYEQQKIVIQTLLGLPRDTHAYMYMYVYNLYNCGTCTDILFCIFTSSNVCNTQMDEAVIMCAKVSNILFTNNTCYRYRQVYEHVWKLHVHVQVNVLYFSHTCM